MAYRICKEIKAKHPYQIGIIHSQISSFEELCYYIRTHLCLVDGHFINEDLSEWIRDELELSQLYSKLIPLNIPEEIDTYIYWILREEGAIDHEEWLDIRSLILEYSSMSAWQLKTVQADFLLKKGLAMGAIERYQSILTHPKKQEFGRKFLGKIYHNLAIAYLQLFKVDDGMDMARNAWEITREEKDIVYYLYLYRFIYGENAYQQKLKDMEIGQGIRQKVEQDLRQFRMEDNTNIIRKKFSTLTLEKNQDVYWKSVDEILKSIKVRYDKETKL